MALIPKRPIKARFVNSICTAIEDIGYFEARYGTVRRVKYTFLTNEHDENGELRVVNRVFNDDMCRTASQRKAIHAWLGHAMTEDQLFYFDRRRLLNTACRLKITPTPQRAWQEEVEIYGPPAKGRTRKNNANN